MILIGWPHFSGPQSRRVDYQDQLKKIKEVCEGKDLKYVLKNRNSLETRVEMTSVKIK